MRRVTVAMTGPAAPATIPVDGQVLAGDNEDAELATRVSATGQARKPHTQARAIVRDLGTVPEEAHAPEGLGRCHLQHGNPAKVPRTCGRHPRSASASERGARRFQRTLDNHRLAATGPGAPASESGQRGPPVAHARRIPRKPSDMRRLGDTRPAVGATE